MNLCSSYLKYEHLEYLNLILLFSIKPNNKITTLEITNANTNLKQLLGRL